MNTHEAFIHGVYGLALAKLPAQEQGPLAAIKLVYGSGPAGTRGVTYFNRFLRSDRATVPFVEVCAFGQESWLQVAGTTLHELGHVLAGWKAGHGPDWRKACARLGLRHCRAAGTAYRLACFDPDMRLAIAALPKPDEGEPVAGLQSVLPFNGGSQVTFKPCGAGTGTRGGKSRGVGSGSRLRLWQCSCEPPFKARVSSDHFMAHCDCCEAPFSRA